MTRWRGEVIGGGEGRHRVGPSNPLFKDGKHRDGNGYVVLSSKAWGANAGRREHRVIAELSLGRKLSANEIVHHINGVKDDNRPENLDVITRSAHPRHHALGRELSCIHCGAVRWYSPSGILKLPHVDSYTCKPCASKPINTVTCKRCDATFLSSKNARFCPACVRKH